MYLKYTFLTWFVCRECHIVRAYTQIELSEIKGGIPICNCGNYGTQGHFMQKIKMTPGDE